MKTHKKLTHLKTIIAVFVFGFMFQLSNAQTNPKITENTSSIIIKGQVSDDEGTLPGTSIILKGSSIGVVSDDDGNYTFPKPLAIGDILVFSYLGYEKKEVKIKENSNIINPFMELESIEVVLTALNNGLPFKSKRK